MPRSPDERVSRAKELFDQGMKLVEIAKTLSISEGTVRSWKSRYQWDNATLQKRKRNVAKRKGGQPKNRNAVGNSGGAAPLRNKNAEKHGAYSKIYWDCLDSDELDMITSMMDDEEKQIIMQIQLYSVRERRLMQRINLYSADKEVMAVLEAELTKVQRAKTRAIESLFKIRKDLDLHGLQKELLDAQIEHMDASTRKLLGTDEELEDLSDTDDLIYQDDLNESDAVDEE